MQIIVTTAVVYENLMLLSITQ